MLAVSRSPGIKRARNSEQLLERWYDLPIVALIEQFQCVRVDGIGQRLHVPVREAELDDVRVQAAKFPPRIARICGEREGTPACAGGTLAVIAVVN